MKLRPLLTALATLILAASCTSGTEGIFASIEREQKIVDSGNLSNFATITHMTEFGGNYYAAGGRALFSRPTGSTSWTATTTINGGPAKKNFMAVGATTGTPTLWAIANDGATDSNRLYKSSNGSTWTDVTPAGITPVALTPVRKTDGVSSDELVVTATDYRSVYLIAGAGVGSAVDLGVGAGGNPITGAAKTGTDYYLVNESNLFHLPSFASPAVVTTAPSASGTSYRGIVVLSGTSMDGVYLSSSRGNLFKGSLSGVTWSGTTTIVSDAKQNSDTLAFDSLLYQDTSGSQALWVGLGPAVSAEGYGYASISTAGSLSFVPPSGTDSNNFTSSKLNQYSVPLLFKGSTGYFLGTLGHGLWAWDSTKKTWGSQ